MKSKLLYIANIRLPTEKAHGVQIMEMCHAFAGEGVDVELVVPRRKNTITQDAFAYYGVEKKFRIVYLPTLDLVRFGKWGFLLQALSFAFIVTMYTLVKKKIDVIYTRDEYAAMFLTAFSSKVVFEIHVMRNSKSFFRTARFCRGIVVISKGLEEYFIREGIPKGKMLVAHDGVNIEEFNKGKSKEEERKELGLPPSRKIVGYVGKLTTMGEEKGVSTLIRAFVEASKKEEDFLFVLVGVNDDEKADVMRSFETVGARKGTYYIVGHVPHSEVPKYLRTSDVLVMNYPNTAHYAHIMSPLKLFEYMASGTPIITTDLPSVREVLGEDEAFFVEPENQGALEVVLLEALRDRVSARHRSRKAFQKVQDYSWSTRAHAILSFTERPYSQRVK